MVLRLWPPLFGHSVVHIPGLEVGMRRLVTTTGLALILVLSGCGGDDDSSDGTTSSSSRTSTSTSTSTTTVPCAPTAGTLDAKANALAPVTQYLTDVTTATDGCVDSITFTFRPSAAPAPSYRVEYASGPFTNSAGETITPEGTVFMRVRFEPAWIADLTMESAPLTYTGPRVITPTGLKSVRGIALYEATEGVVGWVVGLDAERPFTVDATAGTVVVKVG
jgi:hypothetical protein